MVRGFSIFFGVGLVVLGIFGQYSGLPPWVYSLDLAVAFVAVFVAAIASVHSSRVIKIGAPLCLSALLFMIATAAYSEHLSIWVSRWNFAFALAFLLVGLAAFPRGTFSSTLR